MDLKEFFSALAERFYHENALSDMTYAFLRADERFQRLFSQFFFGKSVVFSEMEREFATDGGESRPDLFFKDEAGREYLVEVKLGDQSQHFAQYDKAFPKAQKAFVANYKYEGGDAKGWKTATWREFFEFLRENSADFAPRDLLDGYLEFVKNVANVREFEKMDLTKIESLPKFYNDIIEVAKEAGWTEKTKKPGISADEYFGRYFDKDGTELWLGLYFEPLSVRAEFWTHESPNCKKIAKNMAVKAGEQGETFVAGKGWNDDWFNFYLNEKGLAVLKDGDATANEQKAVLTNFLQEVCEKVGV